MIARGRLTQLAGELGDTSLEETVSQSSRLITELRDEITASRMVPVSQVFDRFPRVVRDAAQGVGKQVEFVVEGKDIELDRSMLDEIGDSIVHLLAQRDRSRHRDARRAHRRGKAGRRPSGAERGARSLGVVIKVSDDGTRHRSRPRAASARSATDSSTTNKTDLTEDELLRLLARPGLLDGRHA